MHASSSDEFNTRVTQKVLSKLLVQQQEIQGVQHINPDMNADSASFLMPSLASTKYAAQAAAAVAPSVAMRGTLGNIHGQGGTENGVAPKQLVNRMDASGSSTASVMESSKIDITEKEKPDPQACFAGKRNREQCDGAAQGVQSESKNSKSMHSG